MQSTFSASTEYTFIWWEMQCPYHFMSAEQTEKKYFLLKLIYYYSIKLHVMKMNKGRHVLKFSREYNQDCPHWNSAMIDVVTQGQQVCYSQDYSGSQVKNKEKKI